MKRAAILIGVDRTGGLPKLADAAAGAERMEAWALGQGMARKDVHLFTDKAAPVEIKPIKAAIGKLVKAGNIDQLVVYFAGHGVNIRYGEFWLLSDAPDDPQAAVNVEGSVVLARRSGITHVVFISDACRTAAEGVQAQGVTGSEIFPNDPVDGPERPVDLFFGTTLGRPALEVKDVAASSGAFRAVYTSALLDVVSGKLSSAVAAAAAGAKPGFVVRPWPLHECLAIELPKRFASLGLATATGQVPDARITSRGDAWVAGFDTSPAAPAAAAAAGPAATGGPPPPMPASPAAAARSATRGRSPAADAPPPIRERRESDRERLAREIREAILAPFPAPIPAPPLARFRRTRGARDGAERTAVEPAAVAARSGSFGPEHFETQCGFKLRGATLADAVSAHGRIERFADDPAIARAAPDARASNVLLVLGDGSGVVLPAIPGYIAALDVVDGELTHVAYEPGGEGTWRDDEYRRRAGELRALRAVIADAARAGVFRLQGDTAAELARRMQLAKSVDPALGLYAAYAYHQLQQTERLAEMRQALRDDLGVGLYDLELLAGHVGKAPIDADRLPPFPLLQQGWPLLAAFGARLSEALEPLRGELVDALWTHFTPAGVERLRRLIAKGLLP